MDSKIYFAVSDIHGFYTPLIEGLNEAGFDANNNDHILLVLGDIFDRGMETRKTYEFLTSLPKERKILIRGNHEDLYFKLLKKHLPESHDFSNCTASTFAEIAGAEPQDLTGLEFLVSYLGSSSIASDMEDMWRGIVSKVKKDPITAFLKSNDWVDYFELGKYIFVHSFIPCRLKKEFEGDFGEDYVYDVNGSFLEAVPSWRSKATRKDWLLATWGCPFERMGAGLFDKELQKGKTLVCGHWHTSDFYRHLKHFRGYRSDIYYSDHLIGIDGGVTCNNEGEMLHAQNVLLIKDGVCYDKKGMRLFEEESEF